MVFCPSQLLILFGSDVCDTLSLAALKIFRLSLTFQFDYDISRYGCLWLDCSWSATELQLSSLYKLILFIKFELFLAISSTIISSSFSSPETPIMCSMLVWLIVSHRSLKLCSFCVQSFFSHLKLDNLYWPVSASSVFFIVFLFFLCVGKQLYWSPHSAIAEVLSEAHLFSWDWGRDSLPALVPLCDNSLLIIIGKLVIKTYYLSRTNSSIKPSSANCF